jgi:hypothetical protein
MLIQLAQAGLYFLFQMVGNLVLAEMIQVNFMRRAVGAFTVVQDQATPVSMRDNQPSIVEIAWT